MSELARHLVALDGDYRPRPLPEAEGSEPATSSPRP